MRAVAAKRPSAGLSDLLPVFARTRGSWWTAAAAAVAALVIVVLHAVTQGLTLSPAQRADALYGRFDHMRAGVASYPLGSGPDIAALSSSLGAAGATDVGVELYARELGDAQEMSLGAVRYEEHDLTGTPTGTVTLVGGTVPQHPGEVCASTALAERLNGASQVSFLDGALSLRVTCRAVDDHIRDGITVYAAPGTWAEAGQGLSQEALRRWGVTATANVFWSGGDGMEGSSALAAALGGGIPHPRTTRQGVTPPSRRR